MNIFGNGDGGPNYFPNSYNGPYIDPRYKESIEESKTGIVDRWDEGDDDNYLIAGRYWREQMTPKDRKISIKFLADQQKFAPPELVKQNIAFWTKADAGGRIKKITSYEIIT